MTPYSVPLINCIARRIVKPLTRLIFRLLSEVKSYDEEYVPKIGSYILTVNHVSLFEPPVVLAFWSTPPEAAGAIEIWGKPGQGILARLYGGIPVHRGELDRQLLDTMISVLGSGRPLFLAPEGGRSYELGMRRTHPGVTYSVDKTRVPVVSIGVVGTSDDFFDKAIRLKRPRLEIRIGKPSASPSVNGKGAIRRDRLQAHADQIMVSIAALMPPHYRGVYQPGFYQTSPEAK
jgi:1-acyl-sn-glycerol-3-phosphate acyltransferase